MFRAILVDDDKWALADIRAVFQSIESGFELVGAFTNADDALVYLMNHPVDLVMTDICMGGKSGFDLLRLTAENHLSFISIIISGHDDFQYVQNAFINRCFYYLLKPVKKAELAEAGPRLRGNRLRAGKGAAGRRRRTRGHHRLRPRRSVSERAFQRAVFAGGHGRFALYKPELSQPGVLTAQRLYHFAVSQYSARAAGEGAARRKWAEYS